MGWEDSCKARERLGQRDQEWVLKCVFVSVAVGDAAKEGASVDNASGVRRTI